MALLKSAMTWDTRLKKLGHLVTLGIMYILTYQYENIDHSDQSQPRLPDLV